MSRMIIGTGIAMLLLTTIGMTPADPHRKKMKLVWSDEFNYAGLPDSTKWSYDLGDGCPAICGWGNKELQYYTVRRAENARVNDGHLIIESHREQMVSKEYSSARLVSKHKGDWTYGRIEARAKLPSARGVWSAIWMLPTDLMYGGWPSSGEIDIMEHVGFLPDSIFSTVHTGRFNGMLGTQQTKGIASGTLDTEFHDYAIEWDAEKIDFLFDGKVYHTFRNRYEGSDVWPFDLDFHLILNIAVGGDWGGMKGVDASAWPQQMEVDYVRVYQE